MTQRIYQVDAFTDRPFRGNPAAVCILPGPAPEAWMRDVAAEMNLSETAFLYAFEDGYRLRWFTPAVEVDLCGHATLASAHVLFEQGLLAEDAEARFHTNSGLLTARLDDGGIVMDFPAEAAAPASVPPGLTEALGVEPVFVGRNRFDVLVELQDEAAVRSLRPDFSRLSAVPCRGVIVTSAAGGDYDFVSRFFAPAAGIAEDPVTGSAHCCLGPYWQAKTGRNRFTAFQASARGGVVGVTVAGERVLLSGRAVTVMTGDLKG